MRQSIVDDSVVPDTCCQITTEERTLEYPQGQYIIMLIPGSIKPEDQGGEGENETIFVGSITFRLLSQNILDPATSDVVAMTDTDTTTGIYVLFQSLLQVIRFWDKCDEVGNTYLIQPMRIGSGLSQPRRNEKHEQYVSADLMVEYKICVGKGISGQ